MIALRILYAANVLVAGAIGVSSLFYPRQAVDYVFTGAYPHSEYIRLVGCLWLAIALLSVLGLWQPLTYTPVLLLQLCYKAIWLAVVAWPAWRCGQPYPKAMAMFFLVWVLAIPCVLPYRQLFVRD